MAKAKTTFSCQNCGYKTPKWVGKCPDCHEWNSFVEEQEIKVTAVGRGLQNQAKRASEIESSFLEKIKTGIGEFDRVIGDGITKGSLTLIGGEPGIGKSTLLMEVCGKLSLLDRVLYVSGEESEAQVAGRAKRLGINDDQFYILNETSWQKIAEVIKEVKPHFFVLDSIQTTISEELTSPSGTLSQIREVTYELMNFTKGKGLTAFVIGHVTKEGQIAGPKVLEHMVDSVIYFEGDQYGQYRMLRAIKNRFGNTNEVGIFEMSEQGLKEINNPSEYFLDSSLKDAFGRSLTCILEGSRPLIVEVQALVVDNKYGNGRRTTQGFDHNRLNLLIAVIEKYFEIPLSFNDVYVNIAGGVKLNKRESDLCILASIVSSYQGKALDDKTLFIGEIGLTGEVRNVSFFERRLREAEQLGYQKIITSFKHAKEFALKSNVQVIGLKTAKDLNNYL